ncbi:MAG TPA: hypothetical protein VET24_06280 [Actinomycetota bacterium]|nr:hypothetical protein [Actinomycetota bacterium]
MSLHGGSSSPPDKKKKSSGFGGFKPAGGGSTTGSTYTPPASSGSPSGGTSPFGGFKFPGMGGPGGGGIWGKEPTGPGMTANWSDSTRLMVAVGAVALILLAAGLLVFGLLKGGKPKAAAAPATTAHLTKFVPTTSSAGGKTQVNITFSDGTSADLLYDPSLNLAELGVTPLDSGALGNFAREAGQFQIDHGGASFVVNENPTPAPPALPGGGGASVVVLPAAQPPGNFLDFKYGDWHVGVWEGDGNDLMTSSDDQSWAANMSGTQTPSGFLVLTDKDPLKLAAFGNPAGPQLVFGDISSTGVLLVPGSCLPPSGSNVANNANGVPVKIAKNGGNHYEGDLCLKDSKMEALIYGSQDFVRGVTDTLEIKNIKAGPAR